MSNRYGIWAIPDSWVRKRLACPDTDAPPSQSLPPTGGGQVGGLNDYSFEPQRKNNIVAQHGIIYAR